MVNHGHKSFFTKQQKKKNQNCFGLITDIFAICPEYIFNQLNVASLMQTSTFLEQHLKQILMPISSEV